MNARDFAIYLCAQRNVALSSVTALSDGGFWVPNRGGLDGGGVRVFPDGENQYMADLEVEHVYLSPMEQIEKLGVTGIGGLGL
ncbi:MAG: hypothetical protein DDT26_00773 [Dehalococcoidia bacterium]|nr:hypothetical protein [Chloroflexota bacterium]